MNDNLERFLKNQLNTDFIGKLIYYYPSVTSTMEIAKNLAKKGATEGTIVIADQQTSGRGRLGRAWLSPNSNVAISIILHPPLSCLTKLIMIASVAVVRAIENTTGIKAEIKWPNDVMIKGKKVCGILIENEIKSSIVDFSVIGIGININLNPIAFPEISALATSLSHELGKEVARAQVTCSLLSELEKLYLQAKSGISMYKEWQKNMETLGKLVRVQSGESVEQGKAEAVTENGNLILRHPNGSFSEIIAGDVTIIKD
jgi:BirA family biotin operon repressor/biotin-[acetyl-CoA-carboxylase] ligase